MSAVIHTSAASTLVPSFMDEATIKKSSKGIQRAGGLREAVLWRAIQLRGCSELQAGHYNRQSSGPKHWRIEVRTDPSSRGRNARCHVDLSSRRKSDVHGRCHHAVSGGALCGGW